ncbi:MAG: arsenite methyltransferase [Proteobacteria bacterium]|nr:arsenite methyltransferase [Pseudomonadota bacterium]MBU1688302.1 arsenite methyltransferase [Pseudomonadota bacterium]
MGTNQIREMVAEAYGRAIKKATPSCCGRSSCCDQTASPISGIGAANYQDTDRKSNPGAAASSFGCGNPLAFSEVKPGEVVLDLGSGAGFDLLLAAERVGDQGRVIGIDMTEAMLNTARRNIATAGVTNIEVRKGIIEELPVDTASVDWVISNCVINLSPEKDRVFKEIARVLKPGGRVRVSDIVVEEIPEELKGHQGLYTSCVAGAISEEHYLQGLRDAGLSEVTVAERLIYDGAMLHGMVAEGDGCGCGQLQNSFNNDQLNTMISRVAGKVWSALFVAQKPTAE